MLRHNGYSDCSQPKSGRLVIGGNARVRFWYKVMVGVDETRCDQAVCGVDCVSCCGRGSAADP